MRENGSPFIESKHADQVFQSTKAKTTPTAARTLSNHAAKKPFEKTKKNKRCFGLSVTVMLFQWVCNDKMTHSGVLEAHFVEKIFNILSCKFLHGKNFLAH